MNLNLIVFKTSSCSRFIASSLPIYIYIYYDIKKKNIVDDVA